ncbi:ATP-dependent DNA helicase [Trichonephila clavipes]|nr:ATP-dependent DNA helicase [Trichonephila clavipes]
MTVFDVTSSDGSAFNEVYQYETGRYISSDEAVWRILNFPIHERYHTVIKCPPGKRTEATSQKVMLLNELDLHQKKFLLISSSSVMKMGLPALFFIIKFRDITLGMYRKTIEGRIFSNYKEACQVRGLLENDEHWNATLEEAAFVHSPRILRDLFAAMLQVCVASNPKQLWINHQESLSKNILHQVRNKQWNIDLEFSTEIFNKALIIIKVKIRSL